MGKRRYGEEERCGERCGEEEVWGRGGVGKRRCGEEEVWGRRGIAHESIVFGSHDH